MRKTKLVRLHLEGQHESLQGVLVGKPDGHYRLANARLVTEAGSRPVDGEVWVPKHRVLHMQVIG